MGIELIIPMLNDDMDDGDFISPCSCNNLDNFGHIPLRFGHLYWLSRSEGVGYACHFWLVAWNIFSPDIGDNHPN